MLPRRESFNGQWSDEAVQWSDESREAVRPTTARMLPWRESFNVQWSDEAVQWSDESREAVRPTTARMLPRRESFNGQWSDEALRAIRPTTDLPPFHVALLRFFLQVVALVVELFALGEGDFNLGEAPVRHEQAQRDDGQALVYHLAAQLF